MACVVILSSFWLVRFFHSLSRFGLKIVSLLLHFYVFLNNKVLTFLIAGFIMFLLSFTRNWGEELIDTYQQIWLIQEEHTTKPRKLLTPSHHINPNNYRLSFLVSDGHLKKKTKG